MDVFTNINKIPKINGSVLTIGSFDGLHLGHQEVIKKVVAYSNALKIPSVVVTFEPHPKMILSKKKNFDILMNINDKISLLEKFGIDATFVIPFNFKFSTRLNIFLINVLNPSL